jgi:hypothetical protein
MASSLIVGTDTYATVAEADAYARAYHASTDAKATVWAVATEGDKDVFMRRAAQIIDGLRLAGIKAVSTQAMAFPRALPTAVNDKFYSTVTLLYREGWYTQPEVPASVKYAQIEIALQLAVGEPRRAELQRQGVRSVTVGKVSETYAGKQYAVVSHEAREMLSPYTVGSVGIC